MKSITVAGDNLFRIAASYLGDATQWIRIAELNNLSDPMLDGLTTLLIPDTDPECWRRHCCSVNLSPTWRAPRLRLIANGEIIAGAMDAEVVSNNYYAADRFSASVALGIDHWAEASFWASEPDILLDVQFSLDGGASFTSLVQGAVDRVSIDPTFGLVHLDGRDLAASLIETPHAGDIRQSHVERDRLDTGGRHNLTPRVSATTTPVGRYYQSEHDRITLNQFSRTTTEWDLLVFLARHEGFDVFVEGQALYFQPTTQGADLAVSLRPEDVIDLQVGAIA